MHALPFLHIVVIGLCFDGIKFCPGAKLGPRGLAGEKKGCTLWGRWEPRIEEGSSFKLAEN